ncbi:outer membrane transport energization protein ExbD [Sedimentitalea nanhaiensis]|uniref:Outer membrane transport energization protein ExbD n=1 Tax=Sedimentitalea nanhaiensis TaxID=999627 RepID=A0A1I7DWE8_9RHOB|nr:outer membrane transport energization protein ExbD [Sedimentitalea nanhaiensis]
MAKPRNRRRKLQVTSLIDIIFLLLLFFMLTSTFSKFSEVALTEAASGGAALPDVPPFFLQLDTDIVRLNGEALDLAALDTSALGATEPGTPLLVSLQTGVDAQRLTDLLVALRKLPRLSVTVLGS